MIIDCISDLHGAYPKLDGGDLLIMGGDYTAKDSLKEWLEFYDWVYTLEYRKIVYIGGNHDNCMQSKPRTTMVNGLLPIKFRGKEFNYLEDSGCEFEGLKIYGSPWTIEFEGMNPHCKAFTVKTEEELEEKWKKIPWDTNILITHSPAHSWFDVANGKHCGSPSLQEKILNMLCLKLHVCGHIHEGYGAAELTKKPNKGQPPIQLVNASIMNEHYEPINEPVRVIL